MLYGAVVLIALGLILWLAAIMPTLGYVLVVVGVILLVVSLLIGYRGRGL